MNFQMKNVGAVAKDLHKKKAEKTATTNQEFTNRLDGILNGGSNSFTVGGTTNEIRGRLEGLERARLLTGKSPFEVGQDYQDAFSNIQKRVNMSDTASELLRANKAGAVADAKNELTKAGVKGGAALNATSQVERAKSYDMNNQLIQNQRQAEMDYMNAAKANANFTTANEMNFMSLAAGNDVQMPQQSSGGMTVICTELWRQGFYPNEIYLADQAYGIWMKNHRPEVYYGYRFLADPIIPLMQKSKAFTKLVAFFAVPWAMNMAGRKNLRGSLITAIGEPVCAIVGKLIKWSLKYGY